MTNNIYVNSGTTQNKIDIKENAVENFNQDSKDWASKMDGKVKGIDYSAKYYANEAKNSTEIAEAKALETAQTAENAVNSIETNKNNAITAIGESQASAENAIAITKNNAISGIQSESATQISAIEAKGQEQLDNLDNLADTSLSNLSSAGEKHFLNKTQITNCILEAPNGVATYSNGTITIHKGLKVLMPNGLNSDGTLNNIEYILPNDINITTGYNSPYLLHPNATASVTYFTNYAESDTQPNFVNGTWFDTRNNKMKEIKNGVVTSSFQACYIMDVISAGSPGAVTGVKPLKTFRSKSNIESYITETYHNGLSWYRVYSDGWIEQGGISSGGNSSSGVNITLLKSYYNTNYSVLTTIINSNTTPSSLGARVTFKNTTDFNVITQYSNTGGENFVSYQFSWMAVGYKEI